MHDRIGRRTTTTAHRRVAPAPIPAKPRASIAAARVRFRSSVHPCRTARRPGRNPRVSRERSSWAWPNMIKLRTVGNASKSPFRNVANGRLPCIQPPWLNANFEMSRMAPPAYRSCFRRIFAEQQVRAGWTAVSPNRSPCARGSLYLYCRTRRCMPYGECGAWPWCCISQCKGGASSTLAPWRPARPEPFNVCPTNRHSIAQV